MTIDVLETILFLQRYYMIYNIILSIALYKDFDTSGGHLLKYVILIVYLIENTTNFSFYKIQLRQP